MLNLETRPMVHQIYQPPRVRADFSSILPPTESKKKIRRRRRRGKLFFFNSIREATSFVHCNSQ